MKDYPISLLCRIAEVSKSGYYKWWKNIWYIVAVGDCSVKSAMKNGGIRSLAGFDVHREYILGFQTITVKAWEN